MTTDFLIKRIFIKADFLLKHIFNKVDYLLKWRLYSNRIFSTAVFTKAEYLIKQSVY